MKYRPRQHGITLVEVLVSIVVLALGLLGILGVQMRTLAETQTGVRRAQAIRLIADLSERIHANPDALDPHVLAEYVTGWDTTLTAGAACAAQPGCAPDALASEQISEWRQSVAQNLPSGNAMTFLTPGGMQLGVLVSWRQNERSQDDDYVIHLQAVAATDSGNQEVTCPAGHICHLQYISAAGRCSVDELSRSTVMCPDGVAALPTP